MSNEDEKWKPDAMDITPRMLLQMAIDDLAEREQKGLPPPSKMVIMTVYQNDEDDSNGEWSYLNCGFRFVVLIGYLEVFKTFLVNQLTPSKDE